ncbi:MAG: hypothetical protein UT34_C0001G0055 [candidate division WS6 bacterium GW2011_GWF2_39_15]|uniref:SipW-cognate class signal peptide n=1 Tax=candidate division WS6 bacterium GW2011_GWF2_39_15 TaxID=1619100 RepID=A0A0G0Q6G7_9BACT|nr:MAG: hypothetical protein UT34_C0001G0055 [candidate division WS6 bacterium GW2011_GWF2_39_15]
MKRILSSLVVIAALGALAVSSTLAVFSDTEIISGNTIATSTLDLTLNHSEGKPFSIENAVPGTMSEWEYADIFNSGDLPFEAYMSFDMTSGAPALWNAVVVELETAGGDGICNTDDFAENTIYNGPIADFADETLVSTIDFWHLANEDDASGTPEDNVRAGWTERICQRVGVAEDAPEEAMDASVTFDEIVLTAQDND